ncbi:MAG: adenine phosphoribosyltransferase, partial [Caldivirga sp.]
MMRRREKINLQLDAIFYINAVRNIYSLSFKQLASMLKIPESTLCRYANMEVLPSAKAAADIVKALRP